MYDLSRIPFIHTHNERGTMETNSRSLRLSDFDFYDRSFLRRFLHSMPLSMTLIALLFTQYDQLQQQQGRKNPE